ncbi:MAG TPA: glycosyltransferase family 39 protein [Phycisphaerae bacterium]|nr:glycosyltransferase family 39 protein [Phycisphaerae bacterium]HRW54789.1 glycosyltransferase family 39 protein [Phycisphaerae bacterium]
MNDSPDNFTWEPSRRDVWIASLVGLLFVLAALLVVRYLKGEDVAGFTGGVTYGEIADHLADSGRYSIDGVHPTGYRPPAFPLLLSVLRNPGNPRSQPFALAVNLLLDVACLALTLSLLGRLTRSTPAMVAVALLYCADVTFHLEAFAQRETMLYTALLLAFMNAAASRRVGLGPLLALSVFTGLAWLTRPTGIALIPLLLAAAWFQFEHRTLRLRLARVVMVCCALATIVLPWQVFLYRSFGAPVPSGTTSGGLNLFQGNNPAARTLIPWIDVDKYCGAIDRELAYRGFEPHQELARDQWLKAEAIEFAKTHPAETLRMAIIKIAALYSPVPTPFGSGYIDVWSDEIQLHSFQYHKSIWTMLSTIHGFALAALILLAIVRCRGARTRRPAAVRLIIGYLAIVTLLHAMTFAETRFRLPLDPLLITLGAAVVFSWRKPVDSVQTKKA